MNDESESIWKGAFIALSRCHLGMWLEVLYKISVRTAVSAADIRTRCFPNIGLEHFCCSSSLFCAFVLIRMLDVLEVTGVKNGDFRHADVKCNRMITWSCGTYELFCCRGLSGEL